MISNKGFQCMKHFHNFTQFARTFSVFTQPLFYKSELHQSRRNNFYKKRTEHDDNTFRKNNHAGDYKNNSLSAFTKTSYADTFGNLDENKTRMFEYKEDPDDIEELQRQRTVVYKPWDLHINEIKCHLGRHNYRAAREILDDILKNEKRRPPHYVFDLLLSHCARCGDLKEAYKLYLELKKRQYPITGGNYTSVFNAAALCSKRELALERIRKVTEDLMTSTFHQPNVTNYNAMMKAYARHGDMEMCLKIIDAVIAERGKAPVDTYNHLLQACVTDKNAGFRHAIAIWHKMLQKKTKPDCYTFNLILRCVRECSLGPVELIDTFIREILSYNKEEKQKLVERTTTELPEAVEFVNDEKSEEMEGSDLKALEEVKPSEVEIGNQPVFSSHLPNLFLRNPVIGSIVKLNKISTPQDRFLLMGGLPGFFKLLSDFKVKPDKKMLAQLIDVIPNNFEAEEECIKFLEEKEIKLTVDFVNVLLKRRIFRRENKDHIKDCLKLLQLHSLTPDIFTYGTFALSCDTLEEAEDFLRLLEEAGVSLNTPMWNALLLGALRSSDLKYAKAMLQVGKKENVQPDSISIKYLKRIVRSSGGGIDGRGEFFGNDNENIEGSGVKEKENSDLGSMYGEWRPEKREDSDLKSCYGEWIPENEKADDPVSNNKSNLEELSFKTFNSQSRCEEIGHENQNVDNFESIEKLNVDELNSESKSKTKRRRKKSSEDSKTNVEQATFQENQNLSSDFNSEVRSESGDEDDFQKNAKSNLREESEEKTSKANAKSAKDDKFEEFQNLYSEFSQKEVESELGKIDDLETKEKEKNVDDKLKSNSENIEEIVIDENDKLVSEYLREKMNPEFGKIDYRSERKENV